MERKYASLGKQFRIQYLQAGAWVYAIFALTPLIVGIVLVVPGRNAGLVQLVLGAVLLLVALALLVKIALPIPRCLRTARRIYAIDRRMVETLGTVKSCVPCGPKRGAGEVHDDGEDEDDEESAGPNRRVNLTGYFTTASNQKRSFVMRAVEMSPYDRDPATITVYYDPEVENGSYQLMFTSSTGATFSDSKYDLSR